MTPTASTNFPNRPVAEASLAPSAVAQHPVAILLDRKRQSGGWAPPRDPRVQVARSPVVGGHRIRPVAVAPIEARQVGTAQLSVGDQIKPVAAARIERRRRGYLHRPLRALERRTPHARIGAVARFGAINRK